MGEAMKLSKGTINPKTLNELIKKALESWKNFSFIILFFSCNQSGNTSNYDNQVPEFSLSDTNNEIVSLSDFKGKVVLIDFLHLGVDHVIRK